MRNPLTQATLFCALALCSLATLAKVEVEAAQHHALGSVLAVKVSEDIAPGDYEALLQGIKANPGTFTRKLVLLDNIGGSAPEAIRMGRLLRELGFDALVPATGVCQGSCVYLLAAGHKKTVNGHVGLHRPYFPSGDSALAQSQQSRMRYNAQAYFREMNVASQLAGEMQRIEPHKMRVLSAQELARFRLN